MKKIIYKHINCLSFIFCFAFTMLLSSCFENSSSSYSNEDYGEYHNIQTGRRQSSYKGSIEQQNDIATLDKMIEEGY